MTSLKTLLFTLTIILFLLSCDKDEKKIIPQIKNWTPQITANKYWEYETRDGEEVISTSRLESMLHSQNSDIIIIKSTESSQKNESHYTIKADGLYRIAHKGSPVKGDLRTQETEEDTLVSENVHTLLYPIELGKSWTVQTTNFLIVTREYLIDTTIILNNENFNCVKIKRTETFGGVDHIEHEYLSPIGLIMIKNKTTSMTLEGGNGGGVIELITTLTDYGKYTPQTPPARKN